MFHPKKEDTFLLCVYCQEFIQKYIMLLAKWQFRYCYNNSLECVQGQTIFTLKTHTSHTVSSFLVCITSKKSYRWEEGVSCKFILTNLRKKKKRSSADVITTSRKQMPFFLWIWGQFRIPSN